MSAASSGRTRSNHCDSLETSVRTVKHHPALLLCALALFFACANHEARVYRSATLTRTGAQLTVTRGTATVFVTSNHVVWPFPDRSDLSRLYIEVAPRLVQPNAAISLPSTSAHATVWWSKASDHISDTCSGSMFIDNVDAASIIATVNVRCKVDGKSWDSRGSNIRFQEITMGPAKP